MGRLAVVVGVVVLLLLAVALTAYATKSDVTADEPSWNKVIPQPDVVVRPKPSFAQDIQPILNKYCVECHSGDNPPNGLRLDTYAGVMKGTRHGPVVVSGEPEASNLLVLVKHEASSQLDMPHGRPKLSRNRVQNIENWIREGAPDN